MHPVNGSNARQAFTSPLFWAFMLMCVLVGGVVLGFVAMRRTTSATSPSPHLKPMAMLEAMVAISAGVLLWMGFWDFIDVYLVPRQWWAKLCMVIVGALGSILTRSLYDEQLTVPPDWADEADGPEDAPRSPRSASGAAQSSRGGGAPPRERRGSSSFGAGMPPVLGSPVLSASPLASRARAMSRVVAGKLSGGKRDAAYAAVGGPDDGHAVPSSADDETAGSVSSDAGDEESPRTLANAATPGVVRRFRAVAHPSHRPRKYFDAPKFSLGRCSFALLSILSGLTLWVGTWDLLDEHMLPAIFNSCVKEPNPGCAAVKLGLIGIGALGMYWTRSLYGDRMVQPSQFQPIA
jgi:hypothetical protein